MAKTTTSTGKLHPCACSTFEAHTGDADDQNAEILTTGCARVTKNSFAQGHDAKLVSFLVQWQLAGHEIHSGRATGVLTSHGDAVAAAQTVSGALAVKAKAAITNRQAKNQRAAEAALKRLGKRHPAPAETEPTEVPAAAAIIPTGPAVVRVRVGRWEYDATLNEDWSATYTSKSGSPVTVAKEKYTLI